MLPKRPYIHFLCLLLLSSCNSNTPVKQSSNKIQSNFETIAYYNKGLIHCDTLMVYNNHIDTVGMLTGLNGTLIQIDSISKKKIILANTDDSCYAINMVHIKIKNTWYWVHSPYVLEYSNQSKQLFFYNPIISNFKLGDTVVFVHPLNDFSIGVSNADGLTGCGQFDQVSLIDIPLFGKAKLAKSKDQSMVDNYANGYFSLDQHDGWSDSIKHLILNKDTLELTIFREYQEGSADLEVKILLKKERFEMLTARKTNIKDF